ncbi:MAG: hypothetical protein ABWX68_06655 [Arthrobacter sp.]|uniref:hypothetical protein n=1 Tax=Arthrobacter sp. TaxID=1667 RepID=UPI003475D074
MNDDSAIIARLLETQHSLLSDLDAAYSRERALLRKLERIPPAPERAESAPDITPLPWNRARLRRLVRGTAKDPVRTAKKALTKLRTSVGKK